MTGGPESADGRANQKETITKFPTFAGFVKVAVVVVPPLRVDVALWTREAGIEVSGAED
jgi:hypothetical protein